MAIESSNRSPSPMSIRQNPNPNPNFPNSRNHAEKRGDGSVRRSANGSPFPKAPVVAHPTPWCFNSKTTPSNSPIPTDHIRRSSFSKESAVSGLLRDSNEHKENKKPNPNSIRGSKNFMSPTISAVSKVTTPSPRKKVLAERNEAVRTSASLSDGKFLFFAGLGEGDLKGETENCEFRDEVIHQKEVTHVSTCEARKRVTFDDDVVVLSPEAFAGNDEPCESLSFVTEMMKPAEFAENEQEELCLNVGKGTDTATSFVSSSPSPIAPLDADPCIPSYDPKTNFLSPRPQFLRYNPDRKAALYLENHQPKNLEDSLSSETCSDNDVESNAEEVQSEEVNAQEAESEFIGSSFSSSSVVEEVKLESPDDPTPQAHEEEMCVEEEEEMSDEEEETCVVSKPRFFTIWRAITLLACFGAVVFLSSMIDSNAPDSVLSKVYRYNHPIYEFARADFSGSLHSMREWSATYLPLMISSFKETETEMVTPSQFLNFSALVCDANDHFIEHRTSGFPRGEGEEIVAERENQFIEKSGESPPEAYLEEVEVQGSPQFEEAELPKPDVESQPVIEDVASEEPVIEDVASEEPVIEDVASEEPVIEGVASKEPVIEDVASEEPVIEDVASQQTYFNEQIESENEVVLDDSEEPNSYNTVVESGEADGLESFTVEGSAENQHQGAVSLLVASLCVAIAVSVLAMFAKYKKAGNNKPVSTGQPEVLTRKEEVSFNGNPSHGSQMEAEDMDAETYNPSAMSSYSIYDKTEEARGTESEAQSKERKQSRRNNYKRESLASSSSEYTKGSASYGSFTTYSILPTKNGDEEFVTPVRRSSRIRKQV